ncbi:MAG TPA: hypothetical protein VMK31_06930 [Sphingomicrobium sp.]|nr:hypothetical protein [Sphingomicrobium sp.]
MRHLWIIPIAALSACADVRPVEESADDLEAIAGAIPEPSVVPADSADTAAADANGLTPDGAAEEGMEWSFARDSVGPKLAYGAPDSDNVKLMLRCTGGESLRVSFTRPEGAEGGELLLRSGGEERRVDAIAEASQPGGVIIEATVPMSARPLQNFRTGSTLDVLWQGEVISVPAAVEEARQLFAACRASR